MQKLIRENPDIISANVLNIITTTSKISGIKPVYSWKWTFNEVNSAARIKKVYPYSFRIATEEEIEQAIEESNPDIVFLHKVGPEGTKLNARCYKVIIAPLMPTSIILITIMSAIKNPDGFLESDFKNLVKK